MTKIRFDDIEIVDPPLQELSKKPSFFKSGCLGGCGCLVTVIIVLIVAWRILLGTGPVQNASIPSNFPSSIPVYDRDAVEKVTVVSGKYKKRREALATTLPQIVMGSFSFDSSSSTAELVNQLWNTFTSPSNVPNEITLEWQSETIDVKFMSNFYKKELTQRNFTISNEDHAEGIEQFSFTNDAEGIQGLLLAEPLTSKGETGIYVTLKVLVAN